ncbi:MAG: adenylyl cyclase [Gammaproteobacteria bacterium]|nr:MAG: adenylyl cyclase [Gammaproteobacteria bacterium]
MKSTPNITEDLWSDHLLRAIADLRQQLSLWRGELDEASAADFSKLFTAAAQINQLFATPRRDRHEVLNTLGVIKGYTELLLEDLCGSSVDLYEGLSRLHKTILAIESSGQSDQRHKNPGRSSDPGFILAVDDRRENRDLIARYLTRMGHTVITAASGEEAIDTLATTDVDVVLLDLIMPGLDGRETLKRIKEHPQWRATPVVVISGRQDMAGIIQCIETGAEDYLFKPFNPVLLQARIKAGIERKRWHNREQSYRAELERKEKFIRDIFGRYLSDEIVTDILEHPQGLDMGGDLREVTIMMSDIRGFTSICEGLPAAKVVKVLNRYLGAMADIIIEHQGTIDEFLGDAILAVFGAPQRRPDDADRAVRCALAMQAAMADINAANIKENLPVLESGIALNTGVVVAGNIGSKKRSKYGFVGHPMNVTSRIEEHAHGGMVIASQATLDALSGRYILGFSRNVQVKGVQEPLCIHQIKRELP